MIDRKLLRNVDWVLVLAVLSLVGFGLAAIYSATYATLGPMVGDPLYYLKRQLGYIAVGSIAGWLVSSVDYRVYGRYARFIYLGVLLMLIGVLIFGDTVKGTTGWFRFGSVGIQPAEVAKVVYILVLARYLEQKESFESIWDLAGAFVHVGIPLLLILKQPDFGTAMVFVAILFGMLYMAGAKASHLLAIMAAGVGALGAAVWVTRTGWIEILKPHQVNRILVFFNPYAYRTGAGWNVIQSIIAIGSGQFFGKGMFQGTQTQLNFLPEHHTDFIFSVVAEEMGFVGAVILLVLYFILLQRGLRVITVAKDRYGALVAAGVVSMFTFHLLINVGMTMGIMPVAGIPLPFVSFGGSAMLTNLIAVGILLNIQMRRQKIRF